MEQPTKEAWRPVVGHVGYDVSSLVRVRSWRRPGKAPGLSGEPHMLKLTPGVQGKYQIVTLAEPRMKRYVHHLVAEAFIGPRPAGRDIAHWDNDGHNNAVSNLRYATYVENMADKIRHGTTNRGERCGSRKLSWDEVQAIRDLYGSYRYYRKGQVTQREIAKLFGISQQQVNRVVSRNHWTAS
jgi:hypothetical protein